jgi:hypothetical protein
MEYLLQVIALLLLYSQSVYFPFKKSGLRRFTQNYLVPVRWIALGLLLVSVIICIQHFDVFTGLMVSVFSIGLILSLLIIILPLVEKLRSLN